MRRRGTRSRPSKTVRKRAFEPAATRISCVMGPEHDARSPRHEAKRIARRPVRRVLQAQRTSVADRIEPLDECGQIERALPGAPAKMHVATTGA